MKKLFIIAALMVAAFPSCTRYELSAEEETVEQEYQKSFTFTVKGDFLNPEFSDMSRANTYMTADGTEMTDLWVIDYKDGEIKQTLHQGKSDADWGRPKMSLTIGDHHVYFLASRGTEPAFEGDYVTWTKPLDTFYLDYQVSVSKTSNGNRAVTLKRVATKMQLVVDDEIATGTTAISLKPKKWFDGWDILNGKPIEAIGYKADFGIANSLWGRTGLNLSVWSLSGSVEWSTDVEVVSKAGETENAHIEIAGAPFLANRTTIYRGNLYNAKTENSVALSTEWLSDYEGVY